MKTVLERSDQVLSNELLTQGRQTGGSQPPLNFGWGG